MPSCSVAAARPILPGVKRLITGEMRQGETPDWGPLERLIGLDACARFMWMFDVVLEDGTILNVYKHSWTRASLHLSRDGRAFWFAGRGSYREVDPSLAVMAVFGDTDDEYLTDAEEEAVRAASLRWY
jgi:hypothetical protein